MASAIQASDEYTTLTARVSQAQAVIETIMAGYNEQPADKMAHVMPPASMQAVLWATRELLDQAQAAITAIDARAH